MSNETDENLIGDFNDYWLKEEVGSFEKDKDNLLVVIKCYPRDGSNPTHISDIRPKTFLDKQDDKNVK